jgi:hypothetical protein
MNQSEWIELVQLMQAEWPREVFPAKAMQLQYEHVKNTSYAAGEAAVRDLATDRFAPNAAQIAQRAGELIGEDLPDFDQVRAAFKQILKGRDIGLSPGDHIPLLEDWQARKIPDLIAAYFDAGRFRLWCNADERDTTFVAQQRDEWRSLTGRSKRDRDLLIAGVDRAALRSGRGEPGKLNAAVALGVGASEDEED